MNIVVCVKPVPDPSIVSLDAEKGCLETGNLVYTINPNEMVAVEAAVRIREKDGAGEVTVVSVAPPESDELLRCPLSLGADECLRLWDEDLANADSFSIGVMLAKLIALLEYDIILCGHKAADTEAGQVGSVIADTLDLPMVSRITSIEILPTRRGVSVRSRVEVHQIQELEAPLPALFSVDANLNTPRYASLPSLVAACRRSIREYNLRAIGLSSKEFAEPKTKVVALSQPERSRKRLDAPDSALPASERINLLMSGSITEKKAALLRGSPQYLASEFNGILKSLGIGIS